MTRIIETLREPYWRSRPVVSGRLPPPGTLAALLVLAAVLIAALMPWLFTGSSPFETNASAVLQAPGGAHVFGTDQSGRDVFSRVVYGARYSVAVGLGATGLALVAGLVIGIGSGLAPRRINHGLSRLVDILMAFPEFLLALVVIAIIGTGEVSIVIAVAAAAAPVYARVARVQTMVVARTGYVRAARSLGVHPGAIIVRHILPNTLGPLLVMATIGVGTAIVSAAGLSFLGLGPQPPTPEWGIIMSEGRNFLGTAWWIAVFPGLAITATVIATSAVGRFLRYRSEGRYL